MNRVVEVKATAEINQLNKWSMSQIKGNLPLNLN